MLAALAALGVGELAAGWVQAPSLVVAVADAVVDLAPGGVLHFGIEVFGRHDKTALLLTIVLVSLAAGGLLGPVAARVPDAGAAFLVAFGLMGVQAEAVRPDTSFSAGLLVGAAAALAGFVVLRVLLREAGDIRVQRVAATPGRGAADRRRFLGFAVSAAAGASLAAVVGRGLGPGVDVEAERASVALPMSKTPSPSLRPLTVDGISPLVTPNEDFYRIDTAFVVPRVAVSEWRLRVTGMVDRPFELSFDELLELPAIEESVTLACVSNEVGGDLVGNAIWRGVRLADVLARAGVQPDATQVVGRSVDGFTVGFPTEVALDGRAAMVAYAMNGEPLPAVHGFPARLVVPGLYGYVSATKWLAEIELTTLDAFDAYWIPRGWSKDGPIKTQSRIDTPTGGRVLAAGRAPIAGVAWGGVRGISKVEVRITATGTSQAVWHEARLGERLSSSSWRQWVVDDWTPAPGVYELAVRATDGEGTPQTEERRPPAPDGATGLHTLTVRVREA